VLKSSFRQGGIIINENCNIKSNVDLLPCCATNPEEKEYNSE